MREPYSIQISKHFFGVSPIRDDFSRNLRAGTIIRLILVTHAKSEIGEIHRFDVITGFAIGPG